MKYKKIANNALTRWIWSMALVLLLLSGCGQSGDSTGKQSGANDAKTSDTASAPEDTSQIQETAAGTMEVTFLDVGQADCILIQTEGHAMLVDAGKNEDGDSIVSFLKEKGVDKLDYVLGTHPHEDHIGGLDTVIDAFQVENVILPGKIHTSRTFEDVLAAVENKGLEITLAQPGDTYTLGQAGFTILSPNGDYGDTLNNWSVGIRLVNGNNSFVMTGDAEAQAEEDICNTSLTLQADVLKAGHHGSETSNTDLLLNAVSPEYAVISCGKENQYGHPDASVLNQLKDRGISVYRTDEQGTITAVSDGSSIRWSCAPSTSMAAGTSRVDTDSEDIQPENRPQAEAEESEEQEPQQETQETGEEPDVHITDTGSKYHRAGCQYLKDSDIRISLPEAKERGLAPCGKCKPPQS